MHGAESSCLKSDGVRDEEAESVVGNEGGGGGGGGG